MGCTRVGRPRVGGVRPWTGISEKRGGGREEGETAGEGGRSRTSASLGSRTETFYNERP